MRPTRAPRPHKEELHMNILKSIAALACLAVFSTPVPAVDGAALYKENCAKCHGDSGRADNWRGYLVFAQDFSKQSFQAARSDEEILEKINRGPRIMPAYEEKLTLDERLALVRVIRGFAPAAAAAGCCKR